MSLRRVRIGLIPFVLSLATAPAALGETLDFAAPSYRVAEGAGSAQIAVARDDASTPATVRYGTTPMSAVKDVHYRQVKGVLRFAPGEAVKTFAVPLVADGTTQPDRTVKLSLFGLQGASFPGGGSSATSVLTIADDDQVSADRDDANPLGLQPAPPPDNPLLGARFYVNEGSLAAVKSRAARKRGDLKVANLLDKIADQPETKRFGSFDSGIRRLASAYFRKVEDTASGTVPVISTYAFPHERCGGYEAGGAAGLASYKRFVDELAAGIGNSRTVILHEIDATITYHCLSAAAKERRAEGMRYAVKKLTALPRTVVYIDAGAADGPFRPAQVARILRSFGIAGAQGFFLNATHQDETADEIAFGNAISRQVGGKGFVINTATNGRGPRYNTDRVRFGNTQRCNPIGAGLGVPPTSQTGRPRVDAFLWIGQPGRSAGPRCARRPAPPVGAWWQEYALMLARNAVF